MSKQRSAQSTERTGAIQPGLAAAYDELLEDLSPPMRRASARLLPRVRSKAAGRNHWATTFSTLTTKYPTLQAASTTDPALVERANLAHLLLLIYTFVDDRITDHQIELEPGEREFAGEMRSKAVGMLEEIGGRTASSLYSDTLERYTASKGHSARDDQDYIEIMVAAERLAVDYASLGGVSSQVLEAAAGTAPEVHRWLQRAFNALAAGLQWIDDMEDWHEDLIWRRDNLVLLAMRQSGLDPYQGPLGDQTVTTTALALMASDAVDHALDRSLQWLETANAIQHDFGRNALAAEIQSVGRSILSSAPRLKATLANEIILT